MSRNPMAGGRNITVPARDRWDEGDFRVLAVTPGGPTDLLIQKLKREARKPAVLAAMRRGLRLMGATSSTIETWDHRDDFLITAAFPGSEEAWKKAYDKHMDRRQGDKLKDIAYHRNAWLPLGTVEFRAPYRRNKLPPGTWRMGGLGGPGDRERMQKSADYRLLRIIRARSDWHERLNGFYKAAAPSIVRDKADRYRHRDEAVEFIRIPGRKGLHLKVPLIEDAEGRHSFYVPKGCTALRRSQLYQHCDRF